MKILNAVEIKPDTSGNLLSSSLCANLSFIEVFNHIYVISEIDDETLVAFLNEDQATKDGNVHKGRDD